MVPPALFTTMSSPPSAGTAWSTRPAVASLSFTSTGTTTARRPSGFDLRGDVAQLLLGPAGEDDVGPRLGQRQGAGRARCRGLPR